MQNNDNAKAHLKAAIMYISNLTGDSGDSNNCRNSIKESISAVGVLCRQITGANDLRRALGELDKKGIHIQDQMKNAFQKLYDYTNSEDTGIRHEMLSDGNIPTKDEAIFMLVSCSAFVNYLMKKQQKAT